MLRLGDKNYFMFLAHCFNCFIAHLSEGISDSVTLNSHFNVKYVKFEIRAKAHSKKIVL